MRAGRKKLELHGPNALAFFQLPEVRGRGLFHIALGRQINLRSIEAQVFPKNPRNVARPFHRQALGRVLARFGGGTDVDGLVVRIFRAQVGHPIGQPRHLCRGVAVEVHADHFGGPAG